MADYPKAQIEQVQPFVDSVIRSLVADYEEKLEMKQDYLERLHREAQDARELNEALSSQCVPLSSTLFAPFRQRDWRYSLPHEKLQLM
eukprot:1025323-Prorocentrum_minimum.AAC.3